MSEYPALDHFAITVNNLQNSITFYEANFDFEKIEESDKPDFRLKKALMRRGSSKLELIEPYIQKESQTTEKNKKDLQYFLRKPGANHLAFITLDINSFYNRLKKNGVEFVSELKTNFFFCLDLDNTLIEVKEKK